MVCIKWNVLTNREVSSIGKTLGVDLLSEAQLDIF